MSPWIRHLVVLSVSGVGIIQSSRHFEKQTSISHMHLQFYQDVSIVWATISSGQFFLKTCRVVSFQTCNNYDFPKYPTFFTGYQIQVLPEAAIF